MLLDYFLDNYESCLRVHTPSLVVTGWDAKMSLQSVSSPRFKRDSDMFDRYIDFNLVGVGNDKFYEAEACFTQHQEFFPSRYDS